VASVIVPRHGQIGGLIFSSAGSKAKVRWAIVVSTFCCEAIGGQLPLLRTRTVYINFKTLG
jgi:hypothetical protein